MSILRRAANGAAAFVVAFSSVLALAVPATTYAAGQTCTWTGGGSDDKFSTVANWSGCNDAAPTDNDNLVFNVSSLTTDTTVTNDISGLVVDALTVNGTNTEYSLTFDGSLTLNGNVQIASYVDYRGTFTLAKDITITGDLFAGGEVSNIDLAGHTLTVTAGYVSLAKVTGTGSLVASGDMSFLTLNGAEVSTLGNSNFGGTLQALGGASLNIGPKSLASSATVAVASGSALALCGFNGSSISNALTIGGSGSGYGAIFTATSCGGTGASGDEPNTVVPQASVNWAGAITLTADTVVAGYGEFKVSGALSGAYTLTQKAGTVGKVTIASSNNTSKTPNGTQISELLKTTYGDNKPEDTIYVGANEEAVLTGTYLDANVTGGVLKGSGTLKGNLWVTKSAQVAPGMSPGCLTSDTLQLEGTYLFELGGTEACTGYDQLKVLNGANTADAVTIDDTSAMLTTSLYDKFVPKKGQTFVIIEQGGDKAVKGTFKDLPEGATFTQNGVVFKISYVGGDGNDVTLTVQNVPGTPDTGFALVAEHPVLSAAAIFGIAGVMLILARRSAKLPRGIK